MFHTHSRRLIDQGRKAGLGAAEIYRALAARPPEASDLGLEQPDGNGFISEYDQNGQRVYHPVVTPRRPG